MFLLIHLLCLVPPKIQRGPRVMKAKVGYRIDLPCNAQGIPSPRITWFKDQHPILIDNRQYAVAPDGTLSISQVLLSDSGIYRCVASNMAGRDETEITIHVQGNCSLVLKRIRRVLSHLFLIKGILLSFAVNCIDYGFFKLKIL